MSNNDLNDILNELTRRLHGYDEIVRMIQAEKTILETKLREEIALTPKNQIKKVRGRKLKREKREKEMIDGISPILNNLFWIF